VKCFKEFAGKRYNGGYFNMNSDNTVICAISITCLGRKILPLQLLQIISL
jgi:hypothetical protein